MPSDLREGERDMGRCVGGCSALVGGGGSIHWMDGREDERRSLGRGRRGRGHPLPKERLEWPPREDEEFRGSLCLVGGSFSSDLQLLGQTGETGGTSSRKLSQPPLCLVRPQTSPRLPGLVHGGCSVNMLTD